MYDASRSLEEFLTATAAKQPTPGGGSVTALVGALSAAIGEMVLNYSVGKKSLEAFVGDLKSSLHDLGEARKLMLQLMAEDQLAYDAMTTLRKLPADAPERTENMPAAQLACIRVPEAMAATALAILDRCERLVPKVNFYLLSDLAVCADLAMTTVRCAIYNVRVNLGTLDDPADRQRIEAQIGQMLRRGLGLIQTVAPRIWARNDQGV